MNAVEAEAHQSWPPKKIKRNGQTNKKRKTEREKKQNTLLYIK